ncbi:class I SAM-dependent methyltransferase [Thalassotalea castellviae]|uniref:Methyltransferase n=1 Tax=Thalassotalea castellviae TaxID=3075612 RepID=A0ABU2ZWW5_9GAMM|nr:methyltransferase [Thalassotalea sp. W431]MDT0602423.1 methyltransferase [Thalassotalea sp. W431]
MKTRLIPLLTITILFGANASAKVTSLQQNITDVIKMSHRTDADKLRDNNRSPVQALSFFGFKQNMKVIEFAPGNGWYTKILAPLLAEKGELHLAYNTQWLTDLDPILSQKGFESTIKLPIELSWNNQEFRYDLGKLSFGMNDADMILNIREYHNFNLADKTKLNNEAFNALKPGGLYVIVDHTRRHMAVETRELARREDPVKVILEVQSAGFILEKSSDMFYRPDDELRYEVGRKTVTGNTDRFTLVFRKPVAK